MKKFNDARDWFLDARFGMFVHWGLYAIEAWHEQDQMRRDIPRAQYSKLINQFNPTQFDPDAWIDLAQQAGMRYICFTTKHLDGFCLWDTKQTDFNVMNSPYQRDVLAQLAQACQKRDFPLCLYYSCVDWHHPNYPYRNQSHELNIPEPDDQPDLQIYLDFVRAQIRELCTNYGPIHGIWWDINQTDHQDESFNDMIRQLQPAAVINNRGFDPGDFGTPERDWDASVKTSLEFTEPTEACNSVGYESWGYRKDEDYFTTEFLIRDIDNILAKNGNYLLNVGPKADGTIPEQATNILHDIGRWIKQTWPAFNHTIPANELTENREVLLTRKDQTIYVHLTKRPIISSVLLKPFAKLPQKATLLNTGQPVEFAVEHLPNAHIGKIPQLRLRNLPLEALSNEVIIIKLEFDKNTLPT
ncbi:MAG: alpha-L-fucosidase [Sedimentisphaerales bacterium]|nr:alpha-L-fucosidase [Sedimentisphaerales bacterium]